MVKKQNPTCSQEGVENIFRASLDPQIICTAHANRKG